MTDETNPSEPPAAAGKPTKADMPGTPFHGAPIVSAYTRAEAIDDGILVDVSDTAREAGFTYPTCLTDGVYKECVEVPGEKYRGSQDVMGRLWDVLTMAGHGLRRTVQRNPEGDIAPFTVLVRSIERRSSTDEWTDRHLKRHALWAVVGPGDTGEPVVTIMYPSEY